MRRLALTLALALIAATTPAFARFEPVTCGNNPFTPQQEIAEGNKVALEVYKQMPVLPDSDPTSRYVQQLGARLVQYAPVLPGVGQQWPFNFHVVASPEINAFALPGGSVFVNLGTIQAAETEAQLAGVMAHEISHDVMRHSTCNLAAQRKKSIFYGLGAIGSAILLGNSTAGSLAQAGIGMGQNLDFLHMSRGDEQQADLLGVNILARAGYDPRGLPQFFETIQAKYGAGGAQFLSDHPNPGNRTQYVNAEIATLPQAQNPIVNTAAFRTMRTRANTQQTLTAEQQKAGSWRNSGRYASGPGSSAGIVPVSGTNTGTATGGGTQPGTSTPTTSPLSAAQLGVNTRLTRYQAARWSISAPYQWTSVQDSAATADAAATIRLAPQGGAGDFGIAYGALVGIAPQTQSGGQTNGGLADQASTGNLSSGPLADATARLVQSFVAGDPSLTRSGAPISLLVGGQPALVTELRGTSPVALNGQRLTERDLIVTVARPDGDLSWIVFVSPERDYPTVKPLYDRMLSSFSPQ